MLFWTVQTILISFILIFLVHHLITYFKQILTVPKTKDLVNSPIQKYNEMFKIICGTTKSWNSNANPINPNIENYLPKQGFTSEEIKNDVNQEMKNELKSFLKKQMTQSSSTNSTTTDISTLDSYGSSSYYSNY
uniref:Uncharacterized protein n=1 Tax=viral metagenome TaxID=1070528 RepID=A0A6C0BWG5_9ZZZZ